MTDAQSALAQVREALANRPSAGPWVATLRDPGTFQVATVDNFGVYSRHPDHGGNAVGFPEHDAAYIAACSPANIAAILAHVEAQEAEIDRLRAALVAAMEIVQKERTRIAYNAKGAPPAIYEGYAGIMRRLDAIIAQADAALGSEG